MDLSPIVPQLLLAVVGLFLGIPRLQITPFKDNVEEH